MIETIILPYYTTHFHIEKHVKWPYFKRVPLNYGLLLEDSEFIAILQTSSYHASIMKRNSTNLKKEIESLQENIIKYLEKF